MPKLQTFDGPQLDELLARVRREAGADVKIVKANKTRSGGIGGFFSKEVFRVEVELPDAPKAAASAAVPKAAPRPAPVSAPMPVVEDGPAPTSLLELADLVDEAEQDAVVFTPVAPAPAPAAAVVPTVRPEAYIPSTERPSFNAVLNRIASEAGAPPLPGPAPQPFFGAAAVTRRVSASGYCSFGHSSW